MNKQEQRKAVGAWIAGRDLVEGTRVKAWFMPQGTAVVCAVPYHGPHAHIWPDGARIVCFNAATKSGCLSMTVGNSDRLELA